MCFLFSFSIGENKPFALSVVETSECSRKIFSQALVDFTKHFWKAEAVDLVAWKIESSGGGEAF